MQIISEKLRAELEDYMFKNAPSIIGDDFDPTIQPDLHIHTSKSGVLCVDARTEHVTVDSDKPVITDYRFAFIDEKGDVHPS